MKKIICILLITVLMQCGCPFFALAEDEGVYIDLESGRYYTAQELSTVEINVEGIFDSVKIMVDYELHGEFTASETINLSDLPNGRHLITAVLYHNGAEVASDAVRFFVLEQQENVLWENDLSDYQSTGGTFPTGSSGSYGSARGSATIKNAEDEAMYGSTHGAVVQIDATVGADKKENGAYWQVNAMNEGVSTLEFDTFISAVPEKYNFNLRYIDGSTKIKNIAAIDNSSIISAISTVKTGYEKDCWYHFKFEIDMLQSTSALTVTKENETIPILETGAQSIAIHTTEANFRMTLSATAAGQTTKLAFDNFKMWESVASPVITTIHSGESDDNVIVPEQSEITLTLNRALQTDTVTTDTLQVYLQSENRNAVISNVTCVDQTIKIWFAEELQPSVLYRIELSPTIVDDKGNSLGTVLKDWFETTTALLDVINPEIITDGAFKMVKGTMVDTDATGASLIVVLSVWDGNQLVDISYQRIFGGEFTTNAVSCDTDNTLQLLVYNPVTGKTMIKL